MKQISIILLVLVVFVSGSSVFAGGGSIPHPKQPVMLANGIKVDNVKTFDCVQLWQVQYCLITFTFGDTVLTFATHDSYHAIDSQGDFVEF